MRKSFLFLLIPAALFLAFSLIAQSPEELQTACNKGNASACEKLADLYYSGNMVKKDLVHALTLFAKACDSGNASACLSLGQMYDKGEGVGENLRKAVELYTKACDAGITTGCDSVKFLFNLGQGVSFESHTRECNNGNADACIYIGFLKHFENKININQKKVPQALEYYTKACDKSEASGCYFLGVMYENGNGVAKNTTRAAELYKKSCNLGYQNACSKQEEK